MSKETYVLVHGAWFGDWCRDKVKPLLEAEGQEVTAIDLPGSGEDKTPVEQITLESYTDELVQTINVTSVLET